MALFWAVLSLFVCWRCTSFGEHGRAFGGWMLEFTLYWRERADHTFGGA